MDDELRSRAQQAIRERVFPGCVIGVVRQNGASTVLPLGHLTYEADAPLAREDTIYDLASITKSIPVASLALTFIAEGKLSLADNVRTFIPELQNDHSATVEDLLRYRVAGSRMSALKLRTFEEIRTHVFEQGFNGPPGNGIYTNLPAFVLGSILERVSGEILSALAHKYFFEPLDMSDTTFFPHDVERCAPTEIVDGTEIRGIVHDESARVFARARRAVGHAGLFSTASDLLKFVTALLNGKLSPVTEGAQQGLGWALDEPWRQGRYGKTMFSKTGFTGTLVAVDVEKGIGLVILSNRTYPHRPSDNSAINAFRREVADRLLAAAP